MKPRILFLLQVPPPIHGASLRNQSIAESQFLRKYFSIRLIPLRFVTEIKDIGTITITKFFRFAGFLFRYIGTVIFWRPRFIYFSLSPIGNAFYRDVLVVFIGKIFRIPFVFHLRGLGIKSEYPKGINRHLYRFVFRNNFVFCISNSQTEDITNLTFRKVFVVPDGIKQEVAPGEFLFKEQPIVLFLSNYIKSKGVLDFVEAIQILNRRGVDFKARMHGASWDVSKGDLEALIDSYNLKDRVIVGEPLFGDEKFKTMLSADIFVLPTFYELFPGVVLEAMQCGKAIVTTITGGIPEIIEDGITGLLVPAKNPEEAANKIEQLIKDASLRKKLGVAARDKFMKSFTLEQYELNTKKAFESVLMEIDWKK